MKNITLKIPSDVYESLKFPPDERKKEVRRELAVSLYNRGALSLGKARQLADMERWEFHQLLGERKIPRHYTEENLQEDLEYARNDR